MVLYYNSKFQCILLQLLVAATTKAIVKRLKKSIIYAMISIIADVILSYMSKKKSFMMVRAIDCLMIY